MLVFLKFKNRKLLRNSKSSPFYMIYILACFPCFEKDKIRLIKSIYCLCVCVYVSHPTIFELLCRDLWNWYVYHATRDHLNGTLHKYLPSVLPISESSQIVEAIILILNVSTGCQEKWCKGHEVWDTFSSISHKYLPLVIRTYCSTVLFYWQEFIFLQSNQYASGFSSTRYLNIYL